MVLRMKAAALASVMSRWKRLRRFGRGAPLPKQGRRESCIRATVARMPSAMLRACNQFESQSCLEQISVAISQSVLCRCPLQHGK